MYVRGEAELQEAEGLQGGQEVRRLPGHAGRHQALDGLAISITISIIA